MITLEAYREIKRDISKLIMMVIGLWLFANTFGIGLDDTDQDGWHRSGVELIVDYGTGTEYLYKDGALIKREK